MFGMKAQAFTTNITTGVYYQSRADSPWREGILAGTIQVDVLEPNAQALNLLGVSSPNTRIGGNDRHGVDEDDGLIDGYGRSNSLVRDGANVPRFVFSPNAAGEYPRYFGAVEVESRSSGRGNAGLVNPVDGDPYNFTTVVPAYGSPGSNVPYAYGAFFGIYDSRGIREILINSNYLDHVHVGWVIPEPSSAVACATLAALSLRRRRMR
jgi:hypothetical protein